MAMAFGDGRLQRWLAARDVVALAMCGPSGAPLVMPMWFAFDAHAMAFVSVGGLAKLACLSHDPRVSIAADGGSRDAVSGVILNGTVHIDEGDERTRWGERLHARYRPRIENLWGGAALPEDRVVFSLRPTVSRAWGL